MGAKSPSSKLAPKSRGVQPGSTWYKIRHLLFLAAVVSDLAIIGVALLLYFKPVYLPITTTATQYLSYLPAVASIVGNLLASLNSLALTWVVQSYAKRIAVNQGFSFARLAHLLELSTGSFPLTLHPVVIIGVSMVVAKAAFPSGLVAALTPTQVLSDYSGQMPIVDFSSSSYDSRGNDIRCEYGQTYGYGFGCPLSDAFGRMFDAGLQVFTQTIPANYSKSGVFYPNELMGISGAIGSLPLDYLHLVAKDNTKVSTSRDVLKVCVPRTKVTTSCSSTIGRRGFSTQVTSRPTGLDQPTLITDMRLCRDGDCNFFRQTFSDFGHGSLCAIGQRFPSEAGKTSVYLVFNKGYNADLGADGAIECNVTAVEEHLPIRITGGMYLERDTGFTCSARPPPSNDWLTQLTYLGQMVLQKQQGQDGRLESVMLLRQPNSTYTRIDALADSITRMVSVGATEAYGFLYKQLGNSSSTAQYSTSPYTYSTPRNRLGTADWQSLLYLVAPLITCIFVILGWLWFGFNPASNLHFNPLDPQCMAIACLNATSVPREVIEECATDPERAEERTKHLRFRFGIVQDGILGLSSDPVPPPEPKDYYGSTDDVDRVRGANQGSNKVDPLLNTSTYDPSLRPLLYQPGSHYSYASYTSGTTTTSPGGPQTPGYGGQPSYPPSGPQSPGYGSGGHLSPQGHGHGQGSGPHTPAAPQPPMPLPFQ